MGRPSKLTDIQWEAIGKRLLAGEKGARLAREYGVSTASISVRFSKRTQNVKDVAKQIVATDKAVFLLNGNERIEAFNLADELKAISKDGASAARYGMQTAHRLSKIANAQADRIEETANLEENTEALKSVMAMTRGANDAAQIGLNLLNANRDMVKSGMSDEDLPPVKIIVHVEDASLPDAET